jgi:hypothetical protein
MRSSFLRLILLLSAPIVISCAATVNQSTPPANYNGPIAVQPVIHAGDYWIYERPDSTRVKSARLLPNLEFPLWIGKSWRFESEARRRYPPSTSTTSPIPAWAECSVVTFGDITVQAGRFGAFQCECQCHVVGGEGIYQEGCGVWTIWYVPEVKNVVKIKTESSTSSLELVGYKLADKISNEPQNKK